MKFKCKTRAERHLEKIESNKKWRRHFCLFPLHFNDGNCVWLEYVEMRTVWNPFGWWQDEYRYISEDKS